EHQVRAAGERAIEISIGIELRDCTTDDVRAPGRDALQEARPIARQADAGVFGRNGALEATYFRSSSSNFVLSIAVAGQARKAPSEKPRARAIPVVFMGPGARTAQGAIVGRKFVGSNTWAPIDFRSELRTFRGFAELLPLCRGGRLR